MTDWRPVWDLVKRRLLKAVELLPIPCLEFTEIEVGSRVQFADYLDHNELELALDELAGLGSGNAVPPEFWHLLIEAAEAMSLERHVKQYRALLNAVDSHQGQ